MADRRPPCSRGQGYYKVLIHLGFTHTDTDTDTAFSTQSAAPEASGKGSRERAPCNSSTSAGPSADHLFSQGFGRGVDQGGLRLLPEEDFLGLPILLATGMTAPATIPSSATVPSRSWRTTMERFILARAMALRRPRLSKAIRQARSLFLKRTAVKSSSASKAFR